jgi:transcriptional regulator with XRE-family HTH domain
MTNEQIKDAIKAKGYTLKAFSDILGVAYVTLRKSLAGSKPFSEQLRRHILLALQTPTEENRGFLTLPEKVWSAIDEIAAEQGISTERCTENICKQFAQGVAQELIKNRNQP